MCEAMSNSKSQVINVGIDLGTSRSSISS